MAFAYRSTTIPGGNIRKNSPTIANRIMHGGEITKEEAIELIHTSDDDTMILLAVADKIASISNDNSVDVCAIVNARSGKCPENCKF